MWQVMWQKLPVKFCRRIVSQGNVVVCIIMTRPFCEDIVWAVLYYVEVLVVVNSFHW